MTEDGQDEKGRLATAPEANPLDLYARPTKIQEVARVGAGRRRFCPRCHELFEPTLLRCPKDRYSLLWIDETEGDRIGEVFEGRLTLLGLVGAGGMGTVYRAFQHSMEREVAVKVMHHSFAQDPTQVRRFLQEAKSASRLAHPNIITLFDFGQTSREGELYLVMELLRGRSLAQVIRDEGPLALDRALAIVEQVCDALGAAHELGVIHRDIKPDNVFIVGGAGPFGEFVKVIDFGLAKITERDQRGPISQTGAVNGTPAYMSPEQILGQPADERADIYALGIVLYEMLTGRLPFVAHQAAKMLIAQMTEAPRPLREVLPDGARPPAVEDVILAALAKLPGDRPPSAAAFKRQLQRALGSRGVLGSSPPFELSHAPASGAQAAPATTLLPLIGRVSELRDITSLIARGSRLITVTGPAGMGKTRLVQHLAAAGSALGPESFWEAVWFCELTEARSLDDVCHTIARVLGISLAGVHDGKASIEQICTTLAARGHCLLVLDNFEHLLAVATPAVERWHRCSTKLQILTTSREVLRLPGEVVYELPPLSVPPPGDAGAESDAVTLFVQRAQAARPSWLPSAQDREPLAEIVRQLDGMPLAIELAAARLAIMSPTSLLRRLSQRLDLLGTQGGVVRERRRATLRAAIDCSWELLKPSEQSALGQLSVFHGGFSLDAAEAIVSLEEVDRPIWVGDVLQSLREKSLVRQQELPSFGGEVRFGMLESIRSFAAEKLAPEQEEPCRVRHSAYFLGLCGRWVEQLERGGRAELLDQLALERENLIAIHRWAVVSEPPRVSRAVAALGAMLCLDPVLWTRGPFGAHLEMLDQALRYGEELSLPPALLARALHARGEARRTRGRLAESALDCERALALAQQAEDRRLQGRVLWNLGALADSEGRLEEARELLARAIAIHREVGDRIAEGKSLGLLGVISFWLNHLDEAKADLERSLVILGELGDRHEGAFLGALAAVNQERGAFNEARMQYERAIETLTKAGARRHEGMFLGYLGGLEWEQCRLGEARGRLAKAVEIAREVGDRRHVALFLALISGIDATEDQLGRASQGFDAAEAALEEDDDGLYRTAVELHRGHLDLALGRCAGATGPSEEVFARLESARRRIALAETGSPSGHSLPPKQRSDDVRFALRMLKRALETAGSPRNPLS